jgi:uncharacterized protein (TIGR03437 family)
VKRQLLILAGLALFCFGVTGLKDILTSTSAQSPSSEVVVAQFPTPDNTSETRVRGVSRDGKRMVFESFNNYNGGNPDRNREIFVYDIDSQMIIQVTNSQDGADPFVEVDNLTPSINADGTKIVFYSNAPLGDIQNNNYNYEIYLANLPRDTTTATISRLTNTGPNFDGEIMRGKFSNVDPTINDDGSMIVFVSNRSIFNSTNVAGTPGGTFSPNNPDLNSEIMALRLDPMQTQYRYIQVTTSQNRNLFGPPSFNVQPVISGDGMVVAFFSDLDYEGRNVDANGDFVNGEIFLSRFDPGSNGFTNIIQVTDTVVMNGLGALIPTIDIRSGMQVLIPNASMNVFFSFTNPLSFDGRWLVLESAGNYDGANDRRTRNVWLYDTIARSFRRLTNQMVSAPPTQDELRRLDFNFTPSINSAGTFITFNSTLNLVPTSPSDVNTDNGDGSSDFFGLDVASGSFRQLTFTPPSAAFLEQRQNKTSSFISNASPIGDTMVSFSYNVQSFMPNATNVIDFFQAMIRPVMRSAGGASIVNSASFDGTQVARSSLSTVIGNELSNLTTIALSPFPFIQDGVTVKIGNIAARINYVSPTQINFIMPQGIANGDTIAFSINNNGVQSTGNIKIVDAAPGVFTDGAGVPSVGCLSKLPDGTDMYYAPPCIVSRDNLTTVLYGFGTGWRNAPGGIQVKINDRVLDSIYSGPEGGGDLRDQFNVVIPNDLPVVTDADLSLVVRNTSIESNRTKISFIGPPTTLTLNDNGAGGAAATCLVKTPGMPDQYISPPCPVSNGSTVSILALYGFGWRGADSTQVRFEELTLNPIYSGPGAFSSVDQINVILPPELAGRTGLISVIVPGTSIESNRLSISFLPLP